MIDLLEVLKFNTMTKKQRKDMYIARVLSLNKGGTSRAKLIKEASEKFDEANEIQDKQNSEV
jgi:hypothetical protein